MRIVFLLNNRPLQAFNNFPLDKLNRGKDIEQISIVKY